MATSTIELKSGSGSQILFAGRIHANRTEMIIEREFLNKCWICPGRHPSVAAIVSVQREDYSLNVEIVQRAHKFPTKNCSSSFRDCAESKFHLKNISLFYYSFIIMDCLQEPHTKLLVLSSIRVLLAWLKWENMQRNILLHPELWLLLPQMSWELTWTQFGAGRCGRSPHAVRAAGPASSLTLNEYLDIGIKLTHLISVKSMTNPVQLL